MIKPHYVDLSQLSEDAFNLLDLYLNDLQVDECSVKDLTRLANTLADIWESTTPKNQTEVFNASELAKRVNSEALRLLSECVDLLVQQKDYPELTSRSDYAATMKLLNRLQVSSDRLSRERSKTVIDVDLALDYLEISGLIGNNTTPLSLPLNVSDELTLPRSEPPSAERQS